MSFRPIQSVALVVAGCVALSLLRGQEKSAPGAASSPEAAPISPQANPVPSPPAAPKNRDLSRYGPLQQQMLLSARRGADWLYRVNGVKGRFLYGYLPDLKQEMDGDSLLAQVEAALALARAARFTGEERYAVRATQALLALLDETTTDATDTATRHPILPSLVINRLGTAGLLVWAINELPAPQADLLEKSEQLCAFIRRQARPNGSLRCDDAAEMDRPDLPTAIAIYPGMALSGLARSQRLRPAAWKLELMRKAVVFYRGWWQDHKDPAFIPHQAAAWAEAFALTHEPGCAQFTTEMSEWLCSLQYDQIDPRRMLCYGGFMDYGDGHKIESIPDAGSAALAGALAESCRISRAAGDAVRYQRSTEALERALQFLVTLQYTDANTQHFADWYRPRLLGAFHASPYDGKLRIDYTSNAVCAMFGYLEALSR